jgi:UDP-2,4-diacetamido-2,4,6-trideoxy-beta-L-altropyranose hydrolase
MQIAFRVDASATIGTGHVMRCLTLADALKQLGARCTFISRHLPEYLQEIIESKGHKSIQIGDRSLLEAIDTLPHAHFLSTSQSQDAAQTQTILKAICPDWLIIDHYGIDQRWETEMRPLAKKTLVIDDLADRDHDCDLLVDHNLYADMSTRYRNRIPPTSKALLGVQYAILRSEFKEARQHARARKGDVRRLFIFFGGMDSSNFTLPVLHALTALSLQGIEVDVVIGSEHPTHDEIQSICKKQAFTCHIQTKDMAKLLLTADIAIGAGGSTSWERCCLGLPSLAFIVAPNQEALTLYADRLGLLKAASADIHDTDALHKEIETFIRANNESERMSNACLEAIDAQGTQRIVDQMNLAEIELRTATQDDSKVLFEWRNHPSIRAISTHSDPILWESHEQWFNKVLQGANRPLYIAMQAGTEVGVIRFDIEGAQAEISLYLAPYQNRKGLGTQLLLQGERRLSQERPKILKITATVLEGNEASHRLFRRCGYQFDDSIYFKNIQP